jgi:predicted phage tail component-like protein
VTDATFNGVALSAAVPDALILHVDRGLLGARRDTYQEIPGRAGSWLFPDKPGDRSVVLTVNIESATFAARRAAVNALAGWADSAAAARLIIDDEPDRYWLAKLSDPGETAEWLLAADTAVDFHTGPYAWATAISSTTWAAVDVVPQTVTLPDTVDAQPVLELTADAATSIGSFTLTVNGQALTVNYSTPAGAKLTINGISYTVTTGPNIDTDLTGAFNPANAINALVDGVFPLFTPGANTVTIDTQNGAGATITATWRRRYRG